MDVEAVDRHISARPGQTTARPNRTGPRATDVWRTNELADPDGQLVEPSRLGDVVVGPGLEGLDPLVAVAERRARPAWGGSSPASRSATRSRASPSGTSRSSTRQSYSASIRAVRAAPIVADLVDGVAVDPQSAGHRLAQPRIVLEQQNPHVASSFVVGCVGVTRVATDQDRQVEPGLEAVTGPVRQPELHRRGARRPSRRW